MTLEALGEQQRHEITERKARLAQDSSHSAKPPSSDLPKSKPRPALGGEPTGRKRGGRPGHDKHERQFVPPQKVTQTQAVNLSPNPAVLEGEVEDVARPHVLAHAEAVLVLMEREAELRQPLRELCPVLPGILLSLEVFVALDPVDLRWSFDRLAGLCISFGERRKLRWRRGGPVRVVIAPVKYRVEPEPAAPAPAPPPAGASSSAQETEPASPIVTAPMPPQALARRLAAPSLLAHLISDTFTDGLPLHRQARRTASPALASGSTAARCAVGSGTSARRRAPRWAARSIPGARPKDWAATRARLDPAHLQNSCKRADQFCIFCDSGP